MVLLLPRAGLHAMLSEVQVSTQHVIAVMLVNVSRSSEVALDALQRSAFVSASGNAEQFMLLFSAATTITVFLCLSNQFSGCMYTDHLQELGLALFSFFVSCLLRCFQHLITWGCQRITGQITVTLATGLASHL